jgi:hypothetical protein
MKIAITGNVERTQVVVAVELLEALNQAGGGCEQMCFHRRDPRFLLIRDGLAAMKSLCIATLPKSIRRGECEKKIILV